MSEQRAKAGMKFDCIFENELDFIDIDYIHLNKVVRYENRHVVKGEWIPIKKYNKRGKIFLDCSVCHYGKDGDVICEIKRMPDQLPNFCPNCGTPMTEEALRILEERCNKQ